MFAAVTTPVFLALQPEKVVYVPLGILVAVFIAIKHTENIKRLIKGTENKF